MSSEADRPIRVRISITGSDDETTTYVMRAAVLEEERVIEDQTDVRFILFDVEYVETAQVRNG